MPKHEPQSSTSAAGRKPPASSSAGHRSKHRAPSERQANGNGGGASAPNGGATNSASASSSTLQPNLDSLDPYDILGVPRDATLKQIKLSYRKLALKHHPDRQTSDLDKEVAHKNFAAIGNAYEILEDEGRRREYDEGVLLQQQQEQWQQQGREHSNHDPFSAFHHPFMPSMFGGQGRSSRSNFHFSDPFELFEHFFAEDNMGHHHHQNIHRSQHVHAHSTSGRTTDPFFSSSNDPFSHPFFSSNDSGFGGGSFMFGNGGLSQMMSGHFGMMNSMMSQMHSGSMIGGGGGGLDQNRGSSFISSSSSSSFNHGGHQSVSTSTRTTIVNGVRTTVTERTVVHPDGRVERHVETSDGGGGSSGVGRLASANHPALDYGESRRRSRR